MAHQKASAAGTFEVFDPHSVESMLELISAYGDARVDLANARGPQITPAAQHAARVYESLAGYLLEICPTYGKTIGGPIRR